MLTKKELEEFNEKVATSIANIIESLSIDEYDHSEIKQLLLESFEQNYKSGYNHGKSENIDHTEELIVKYFDRLEQTIDNTKRGGY